jgi:flagellar biosynthesis/type III secretory pathway protein FliH
VVKVYNINEGKNAEILQRCETLQGYSVFVARTREFAAELAGDRKLGELSNDEREEAMRRAITWCIDHGVLKSFLEIHGSEVRNMLFDEWKLEEALVVEREEGREEGLEEGLERGRAEGEAKGLERGREEKEGEAVNNLLDFGMMPEEVSRMLKLPLETVLRYQAQ